MQQLIKKLFLWYSLHINIIIRYTCCAVLAVLFIERLCIIFSYEPHLAGIDNNFDYPVIRSLAGYSIYPNPAAYPYAVNPYAPLFFIFCKWVALAFHVSANDTIAVYRVTRSVALLADSGTCILLFCILRRFAKARKAVSLVALTGFFSILCYLGYTFNRSDAPFLLFYTASLFVLLSPSSASRIIRPLTLAVLATLCIFSKQNGISLLLLVPIWLLQEKSYRALFYFILFSSICFAGMFLYFQNFYTDHFFSEHIINSLKNKIDPRWFYVYVFKLMAGSYLAIPLAVSLVIAVKSIADSNSPGLLKKLGVFFALQFLLSTALSLKWGSSQGYYNESFLAGFILITTYYSSASSSGWPALLKTAGVYLYPAMLLFILHITAQLYFFFINSRDEAKEKFAEQVQISNYIKKELPSQNSYVIDLSNADFNFFKNLLYKECAAPNIDAVNCCTMPDKIFNYSELLLGLRTGKILFLIETKGSSQESLWGVDIQHYKIDSSFTSYTVYRYSPVPLNR